MKIKDYQNFELDRRPSMHQYADQLLSYQSANFKSHEISSFKPVEDNISKFIFLHFFKFKI